MNPDAPAHFELPKYPPGFRARRGLNWGFLGLLYTSFYLCRYNLSIANKSISDEFGFSRADMGLIITTALLTYGFALIPKAGRADFALDAVISNDRFALIPKAGRADSISR